VVAAVLEVLNSAAPLPFQIDERVTVGEEARLKYRYLDLRRPAQGAAIRLRSKVNAAARAVLAGHDFVEIETPTLTRSTPEGARDFVVPARLAPGSWYALPQSPQLFKQLLMVAGMERYYQIARCYRDEDFRADRQPEFTQLDIEMSFVEQDDILALGEEIAVALWKLIGVDIPTPLPRLTYAEAMARFGPTSLTPGSGRSWSSAPTTSLTRRSGSSRPTTSGPSSCPAARASPARPSTPGRSSPSSAVREGLAYVLVQEDGELGGPVAKNLADAERSGLAAHVGATPGDCIFFAAGAAKPSRALLGAVRLEIAKRGADSSPRDRGATCGCSTRRCSSPRVTRLPQATSRSDRARGPRSTTPSPRPRPSSWTPSTPTPARRSPTPTTWSATATRSVAARSVSTAATSRSASSRSWA
jgi:aspartyl-tRNA synthetase